MTMGQITNHMSVDALNLMNSMQWVHYVWSIPYVVSSVLYLFIAADLSSSHQQYLSHEIKIMRF